MTRALNKASTKKANLQQFCEELGMSNVSNSTITQLQKSAMDRIYMQSKADVSDPVGFGTHSAMSYGEIAQSQVEYCQWVVATAQEGQCSHRLTRLANWLEQNPDQMGNSTNKQGNKYKTEPKVKAAPRAASSQGSVGSNDTAVLLGAMTKIMTQMENMQERDGRAPRAGPQEVQGRGERDAELLVSSERRAEVDVGREPGFQVSSTEGHTLDKQHARQEGKVGKVLTPAAMRHFHHISQDIAANAFEDLKSDSGVHLIEIACSPESRLSAQIQREAGREEAAVRCSFLERM